MPVRFSGTAEWRALPRFMYHGHSVFELRGTNDSGGGVAHYLSFDGASRNWILNNDWSDTSSLGFLHTGDTANGTTTLHEWKTWNAARNAWEVRGDGDDADAASLTIRVV